MSQNSYCIWTFISMVMFCSHCPPPPWCEFIPTHFIIGIYGYNTCFTHIGVLIPIVHVQPCTRSLPRAWPPYPRARTPGTAPRECPCPPQSSEGSDRRRCLYMPLPSETGRISPPLDPRRGKWWWRGALPAPSPTPQSHHGPEVLQVRYYYYLLLFWW